jgi:hypothetical protein
VILQLPVGRLWALQEIANVLHLWLGCRPCHCGVSHIGSGSTARLSANPLWLSGWLPPSLFAADYSIGFCTTLQSGRSQVRFPMVSLEFFSDIILPVALWPWGRLSL